MNVLPSLRNASIHVLAVLLALLCVACVSTSDPQSTAASVSTESELESDLRPESVVSEPGRKVHRMTIEQIARSIPVVTNGLSWTEQFEADEPMNMFSTLAMALGVPDYLLVTAENVEPGLIIAKFMQDASYRVCARWIERDRLLPPEERTLIVHEDWASVDETDVKESLGALQLRFFSRSVESIDDPVIEDLYEAFQIAAQAAPNGHAADDGWFATCIILMTDPEFIIY
jgi:hypothetical protein